jgi:peptide/nickel transport system substrate-binding protein
MRRYRVGLAILAALAIAFITGQQASAQKRGGILKLASPASPASMSPMEEATIVAQMPMMGVFNNLVLFDQHLPQVSLETIRPVSVVRVFGTTG